jgi:uncharacterized membrane protein YfhO
LADGREFDPRSVVLAEPDALSDWKAGPLADEEPVVTSNVLDRVYRVSTHAPCVLVISEQYYPWWRATLDNASVSVSLVNYAMVGVQIPAGIHRVRLSIRPTSLWAGAAISAASALAWFGLVASAFRREVVT